MRSGPYLIIDDSIVMQRLTSEALHSFGVEKSSIFVAENTKDARAKWKRFDKENGVVLLDLVIPGKGGGMQLLEEFKSEFPNTPVIVVSSRNDRATVLKTKELGAGYYLIKPFDFAKLRAALEQFT